METLSYCQLMERCLAAEARVAALESRADAEPAEIDERAAFNAWNNDTDCPLAGRDAKSAAWLAWSRRAAILQGTK